MTTQTDYASGDVADQGDDRPNRSVLGRIVTVLDAFDDQQVLSLAELTLATGLPRSTVYRFAEQLVSIGWLERVRDGYQVGLRLFELGGMAPQVIRMRECAAPWLRQAHNQSNLTVHLGTLEGTEVVYLDKVSPRSSTVPTRVGGRYPAHYTSLGKAMLAYDRDDLVQALVNAGLTQATASTISTPDALLIELGRTRETGIAVDDQEAVEGLCCVAAPIRGSGRAIAALSISGPAGEFNFRRNAAVAKHAATGVWQELFGPSRTR